MKVVLSVALTVTIIGLIIGGGIFVLGRNELLSQEESARGTITLLAGFGWGVFMAGLACMISATLSGGKPLTKEPREVPPFMQGVRDAEQRRT